MQSNLFRVRVVAIAFAIVLSFVACADELVQITTDLHAQFEDAEITGASQSSASIREASGGEMLPGIFLHPPGQGVARAEYSDVMAPEITENTHPFLLFRIGLRDGFDWNAPQGPNGVRFGVEINGEPVFSEDYATHEWATRVIDLGPYAGQSVAIALITDAIDNNPNYDWALWGRPMVVSFPTTDSNYDQPLDASMCAIHRTQVGEEEQTLAVFGPNENTVPPILITDLRESYIARFGGNIKLERFDTGTPLIHTGRPLHCILSLRNTGLGSIDSGSSVLAIRCGESESAGEVTWPTLEPGEAHEAVVEIAAPSEAGIAEFSFATLEAGPVHFAQILPPPSLDARSTMASGGAVVAIHQADGAAPYATLRTGAESQQVGAIFPLAEVADAVGRPLETRFNPVRGLSIGDSASVVRVEGEVFNGDAAIGRVALRMNPVEGAPRFMLEAAFTASADVTIGAFRGPQVLAGEGGYGAEKRAAIFPGLEYLEGPESSSSERDLWPPYNDRRVPAVHKIATPIMAVQGDRSLVVMMWDANQSWRDGEPFPAAHFWSPASDSAYTTSRMRLSAPGIGDKRKENAYIAHEGIRVRAGESLRLSCVVVVDVADRYPKTDLLAHGPHKAGLILKSFQHYFEAFGFTDPEPPPRSVEAERALSRDGYYAAVWDEASKRFRHCYGWPPGVFPGHAAVLLADRRAGASDAVHTESARRIDGVTQQVITNNPGSLWSGGGCHIMSGELPYLMGYLPQNLASMKENARNLLNARENELWVWRTGSAKHESLGVQGAHTLGQCARNAFLILRAARFTGDGQLAGDGLAALEQLMRYDVPRGGQMWECPMFQPDILPAAHAIRAYCEAYRITNDPLYLEEARYWAWTGLPFLYLWEREGFPAQPYNVISVIGSTFYTHSWLGLPVVWCGLVYAYALQDLAMFDDSFPWTTVARGITHSAMWQQYTDGPNRGTYPDSWDMKLNERRPADINPENILINLLRLEGHTVEPYFAMLDGRVHVNSSGALDRADGGIDTGHASFEVSLHPEFPTRTTVAPVSMPVSIDGAGENIADDAGAPGWVYDDAQQLLVITHDPGDGMRTIEISW